MGPRGWGKVVKGRPMFAQPDQGIHSRRPQGGEVLQRTSQSALKGESTVLTYAEPRQPHQLRVGTTPIGIL